MLRRGEGADGEARKKPRVDYKRAIEPTDPSAPQLKIPLPFTLKKQVIQRIAPPPPRSLKRVRIATWLTHVCPSPLPTPVPARG